jgi:ATP-binding cassette, subfamily B, multidrug efflux pump
MSSNELNDNLSVDTTDASGVPEGAAHETPAVTAGAAAAATQQQQGASRMPGPLGRFMGAGMPVEKSKNFKVSARRLANRMQAERKTFVIVILLAVVSVTLSVIGPRLVGRATDTIFNGIRSPEGIDFPKLHRILLIAAGLFIVSALFSYVQSFLIAGLVQRTMERLRSDVEAKLHRLPLAYIDVNSRGDLLSRVTNDIDNIANSLQQTMSMMLTSVLMVIGVVAMMIVVSPLLAIVAIITVPISMATVKQITKRSRARFMAQWRHTGALNGHVEEAFTGHGVVKAFGRQREVEAEFAKHNNALFEAGLGAQIASGAIMPIMFFFGNLNYVAIAVIGAFRVSSGAMGLGDVQAMIQYSRQFTQPITQFASMINMLQSGVASSERVFELLDADEQSPDPEPNASNAEDGIAAAPTQGLVEFHNVSFSYTPDRPLIEDLSLVAEPGRTVAIVGQTGAGKTTLVNLIMRFYELDGGSITLDGRDIATMPRRELRSQIGMVLQDTWLFGGTIRDNIAYGRLGATDEEVITAAKAAHVDHFVRHLPDGYDTVLDDDGTSVSVGERQLLTIARAFLSDPTILILDEATSSVDTRTEVLIQRAMTALRAQRTSFVIAHRLSTIRDAETILVMSAGRIVEQGNHAELLVRRGAYYALYNAQFAGASTDQT